MDASIHIVIATHRRPVLLRRTLASVATLSDIHLLDSVAVIENGSSESRNVCDQFPQLPLRYFHRTEHGKGRALQWFLQHIEKGFLLFLDDDVRVSEQLLKQYAAAATMHGPGHYFGGELKIDYEAEPENWLRKYLPPSATGWSAEYVELVRRGEFFFSGANFGAFVRDVKAVGGFRVDLGPGAVRPGTRGNPTGQEWDLQRRMWRKGLRPALVPDAPVWHFVPRTNCSADWALDRAYRNAWYAGIRQKEDARRNGRTVQPALKLARKYIRAQLLGVTASRRKDPEERFLLRHQRSRIRGRLKGYFHASLNFATPVPQAEFSGSVGPTDGILSGSQ